MKNRILYFPEQGEVALDDFKIIGPKDGEILVKIAATAISGDTERALITGDNESYFARKIRFYESL